MGRLPSVAGGKGREGAMLRTGKSGGVMYTLRPVRSKASVLKLRQVRGGCTAVS